MVDFDIRSRTNWHWSIGATTDGVIETNRGFVQNAALGELVGHWLHEYTHTIGYCDRDLEPLSPVLTSYWVGYAACVTAGELDPSAMPVDHCRSMLGPGLLTNDQPDSTVDP